MAKAKATSNRIVIQKANTETAEKITYGLQESSFIGRDGKTRKSLGVTKNGAPLFSGNRPLSMVAETWLAVLSVVDDGGIEVIRDWCNADIRSRKS